ncbi:uncharacterized protein LOC130328319 [Hyla sarda]|uniref:uncharacterized protein LOC130328319 n=1 Tax=Hyla sarda TaxID=327740 RepID=UPI0024C3516A|nr:uncharacterized protein LOC130328319 [Hyla sarda]XP_056409418.1 uncharacterized protein LOC130328319 [Hyla sarda]XP_056409419.1 uncharacterized protein LOC130328319 [Hyla sarda]
MSATNSHQILEKSEPVRGVKHVKPPIRPKPVLPPRPKDISALGTENKSPLPSPTCGPCSPTLDIPSALKISQLTGPQPYGTRRTSLKRWSSSVGEEVSQEINALSPVENRSIDVPAKITAQPLSAPAKPPPPAPAWRGKSPFMLTTRGWGEQRFNQLRDLNESESTSQKAISSSSSISSSGSSSISDSIVPSKDTAAQIQGTTTHDEDSRNPSRSAPEEESAIHVRDSIASYEKLSPRSSEDGKMVSPGFGSSPRSAEIKDHERKPAAVIQPYPHEKSSKQTDHEEEEHKGDDHKGDDHKGDDHGEAHMVPPSIGYKPDKKAPSVPVRKSSHGPKSQTEEENINNTRVYSNQIPEVGPGLGHLSFSNEVIVDKGGPENRGKNHHQDDVTPKEYIQLPHSAYEPPQHHDKTQDQHVTSKPLPPKPKERKKPSVQFMVPNEDQEEGQRSMDWTVQETKEHGQKEDVRRWNTEDIVQVGGHMFTSWSHYWLPLGEI